MKKLLAALLALSMFALPTLAEAPVTESASAEAPTWDVGDVVTFGRYEQDDDAANGPEPIEWIVLDAVGETRLLLARYGLCPLAYEPEHASATWEPCAARVWLNSRFVIDAFTKAEQAKIVETVLRNADNPAFGTDGGSETTDKVFLLSIDEVERYLPVQEDRVAEATPYAEAQGVFVSSNTGCCWWRLRSPGKSQAFAAIVNSSGFIGGVYPDVEVAYMGEPIDAGDDSVRPAIWVIPPEPDELPDVPIVPAVTIEPERTVELAEPEETARPEETAEPMETAGPGETAEPEVTAEPEETVEPAVTAEPAATDAPTEAPAEAGEPEPEATSEPQPLSEEAVKLNELRQAAQGEGGAPIEDAQCLGDVIVAIYDAGGGENPEVLTASSGDAHKFPVKFLAESLDAARWAALIYPTYETIGHYSQGGAANRTTTWLCLIDLSTGQSYPLQAATEDPPTALYNSDGTGASGDYKPETALASLAKRIAAANQPAPSPGEAPAEPTVEDVLAALGSDACRATYEALAAGEIIRDGSRGETARGLQQTLIDLGQDITADGSVGPRTLAALNAVQAAFGLEQTDFVDAAVYEQLLIQLFAAR